MRSLPQYTRLEKISVTERPPGRIPSAVAPELSSEEAENQDAQWREIEKMAISGIEASPERIREYLLSVRNLDRQADTVIAGFAIILRTQENGTIKTETGLKDILTLLETGNSGEEIQFALRQIVFESKNSQK
ncbi:MAG: hypothetical protein WC695_08015 [Candidatus Omnitrophota bacterium]